MAEVSETPSDAVISRARAGDAAAIDAVVRAVQDPIYALAVRMLGNPSDAQDATQVILLRIVRHLDSYRGDAAFSSWTYRIAVNRLLTLRATRARQPQTMAEMEAWLDAGLANEPPAEPPDPVLVEESKIICTQAMLQCLDAEQRAAYVLGEVLEVSTDEGATITETTPDAYRKRLQRARERVTAFAQGRCGLVHPDAPCRCSRQIENGVASGMIDPARLSYANHPVRARVRAIEQVKSLASVLRNQPQFAAPVDFAAAIRTALGEIERA